VPAEESRKPGLALEGDRKIRERSQGHQRDLSRPGACRLHDHVDAMPIADRSARRRKFCIADAPRSMRLGRGLERPLKRHLASDRDLDIRAAGQLEDGERVDRDLASLDVARHTRDRRDVRLGRPERIEEREAVVDAGVDVEQERDGGALGHHAMLARPDALEAPHGSVRTETSSPARP
jgi:hypothetical protein